MVLAMGHRWFGSKAASGLWQALVALMPPHAVYIETHLGGGAVMKRKPGALLELLKGLPCAAMVSGYPSALYEELLRGWGSVSLQVMNRAGAVTEKVWFNFEPDRVHWASCAGRDFTHRQTVKRKAASWGRRYRAMPAAERLAVLAAIMAVEAQR